VVGGGAVIFFFGYAVNNMTERLLVPPLRKPAGERQNRVTLDVVVPLRPGGLLPEPAEGWRPETTDRWVEFWGSKIAGSVEDSDHGALRRLFRLYDELDRLWEAVEETGRVVEGSQGQPRPNPLFKQIETFQAEARQLEDRFGLSPKSRLQLGITFADAHLSLSALNERLASRSATLDEVWDEGEA
jgi:P27 family predicted phage terminase small subunit